MANVRNTAWFQGVLLGGFTLVASVALALGFKASAPEIAQRLKEDLNVSLEQVVPASYRDNDMVTDTTSIDVDDGKTTIYRARKAGQLKAVAYRVTGQGYGGTMVIVMGLDTKGKILGVRVVQHAETPGLGDKIEVLKTPWVKSFNGLSLQNTPNVQWAVKKDGGRFDQFSGATITPRAVVKAVRHGLDIFTQKHDDMMAANKVKANAPAETKGAP